MVMIGFDVMTPPNVGKSFNAPILVSLSMIPEPFSSLEKTTGEYLCNVEHGREDDQIKTTDTQYLYVRLKKKCESYFSRE